MTARYINTDPISKSDLAALRRHYDRELSPLYESINAQKPVNAIGTSGTLENIAAMCGSPTGSNGDKDQHGIIERGKFEKLLAELIDSDTKQRSKIRGLDDQRKDQIVAGAVLVGELFEKLKLKRI